MTARDIPVSFYTKNDEMDLWWWYVPLDSWRPYPARALTEQLYGVIMMVVKIFGEKYDKLKQTNMRFLKRNTGEVAVQLDELVEKYKNKLGNKSYGEIQNKLGNKSWWNCSCICKPDFCSVARRPSAGEEGGEGCSVSFAHFFGSWAKIFLWAIGGPMKSNPWNRGGCGVNQWWEKGSSVYGTTS